MWGVTGARLWRSLGRIQRGGTGSRDEFSWTAINASIRNLSLESGSGSNDVPLRRSPLSIAPGPADAAGGAHKTAKVTQKESQAVLTMIKQQVNAREKSIWVEGVSLWMDQSPKKVNLVAELVRGMRVDDALLQMAVSVKRAAKVVSKVVTSARANAIHNYAMNKDQLIVAEAFVGKDKYLKRLRIHGKGKAGKMVRPRCRLTVILKEMAPEKEAELARLRVQRFHGKKIHGRNAKLVPHRVVQTQMQWASKRPLKESPSAA